MEIREIMSTKPAYILATTTIEDAAKKMRELDIGFLAISDKATDKLIGTVTDRDLVISAIANKKNVSTPVKEVMHSGVHYIFENDKIENAIEMMKKHVIRRLIVLNKDKRFIGIVTLGDLAKHCEKSLIADALKHVSKH